MSRINRPADRAKSRTVVSFDALEGRLLLSASTLERTRPLIAEVAAYDRPGARASIRNSGQQGPQVSAHRGAEHARFPHRPPLRAGATAARWAWLEDTYWIVPPNNLLSVLYFTDSQTVLPEQDQTVYHITDYRRGYFWGTTVVQLGSGTPTCLSLVGSVTPQGRVLLNFTSLSDNSSPTITQGIGQMRRQFGQWTMENQMFTSPSSSVQIGHWAYMVQTSPAHPSWYSLPGVNVSVPEFMSHCEGEGPHLPG